jgi:putative phosphoesterase
MRIALIADIHGNAVALETVIAEIATEPVDHIVCLGDVALRGPEPRRALHLLRDLGCPVVLGNSDGWFLDRQVRPVQPSPVPWIRENDDWCAAQMSGEDLSFIATFQATLELPLPGERQLLCFHGSPLSYWDEVSAATPPDQLTVLLEGCTAALLAGGHTHIPLLRRHGDQTIINPGSVGQPMVRTVPDQAIHVLPEAQYALIHCDADRMSIEFRHIPVDLEGVIAAAYRSGMPAADVWERQWRTGIFAASRG